MLNLQVKSNMTNPNEFKEFNRLLTAGRPNYNPWYFLLAQGDKDPLLTKCGWKHPDSRLSYKKAIKMLKHGMNIGIAGTDKDMLVIIDVDNENTIPDNEIKPTLSVRSRSRTGTHHFYFATNKDAKINIPTDNDGEVRACWQYVVAPGSYVACSQDEINAMPHDQKLWAGKYTIERATIARNISFNEFPKVFQTHMAGKSNRSDRKPDMRTKVNTSGNKSAMYNLTIGDVLGDSPTHERFPSLFHGSKTGANTSISNNQVHCFRHNCSLTPLRAIAVLAGLYTCMEAGVSHKYANADDSEVDLNDGETVFKIWKYAKIQGMIPRTDPIPTKALTWFGVMNGNCTTEDLIDGWKLPLSAYCSTKDALLAVGLLERPRG